jgi:hypothetical protein
MKLQPLGLALGRLAEKEPPQGAAPGTTTKAGHESLRPGRHQGARDPGCSGRGYKRPMREARES